MRIAVTLFAYNRPRYLKKALRTHIKYSDMSYYAFVDKSDKQKEIIDIIHNSHLYDVIVPRQEHYGLNDNIRSGIDFMFKLGNDAVIVLEDDLLLADDAILWLSETLKDYDFVSLQEPTEQYPFRCWGWGIKRDKWYKIDWDIMPGASWDVIVNENFRRKGWISYSVSRTRVKHIGMFGVHYNLIGYLKEKSKRVKVDSYYKDKDLLMKGFKK